MVDLGQKRRTMFRLFYCLKLSILRSRGYLKTFVLL